MRVTKFLSLFSILAIASLSQINDANACLGCTTGASVGFPQPGMHSPITGQMPGMGWIPGAGSAGMPGMGWIPEPMGYPMGMQNPYFGTPGIMPGLQTPMMSPYSMNPMMGMQFGMGMQAGYPHINPMNQTLGSPMGSGSILLGQQPIGMANPVGIHQGFSAPQIWNPAMGPGVGYPTMGYPAHAIMAR